MSTPAVLVLADGSVFHGIAIGAEGNTTGEVVFNTAMTGYQEILTDPSYAHQIVTLTYPHIGNTGVNSRDVESLAVWAAGLVIRDLPLLASNWRSEQDLSSYLKDNHIVAIADIDTRQLTRVLRDKGAQNGCIMAGEIDADKALKLAQDFAGLENSDLAKQVTTQETYTWTEGTWLAAEDTYEMQTDLVHTVVVYDYGVKHNILRLLVEAGCYLTVVPATTPVEEVLAMKPDGVFLSNGPGDPAACDYAIAAIKTLLDKNIPLFGICLGHQLLALACGANTEKMKFGHHGANHPVQDLANSHVYITSQNHGFAVSETDLPADLHITHRSLFDNTLQGIRHKTKPAFGFQGHPEASPGPHDIQSLFNQFIESMTAHKTAKDAVAVAS
ncbi:MAG: carbamoyl-phosphate synthase small subunit [Legionellales bacterium]|nr:carbamoyl-phosphate synthase small subunit [Legionellales bacterium]